MHQPQRISPEDFLRFVETDEFRDDWEKLGFDVENDLWDLQDEIMRGPRSAPVIRGTGGLRKLRFSKRREHIGKRGGARVCYAYFEKHRTVLLVMAYGKDEKDDLSATEKRAIADYLARIERYLTERDQ